jgi:tetratricopeptide (TPR) repeat protein
MESARPPRRSPPTDSPAFDDWRERVARTARREPVVIGDVRGRGAPPEVSPPPVRVSAVPVLGCAVRLMMVAVVVILALTVVSFVGLVVFGGSVGAWVEDVGQQFGVLGGVPEQTQRGIRAYRADDFETAERELREAAQSYPRSGMALVYLARIPRVAADPERAGEYLREAVAREPDNVLAQQALADHYFQRANRRRANRAASPAGEEDVSDDLLRAQAHYQRALELDPTDRRTRGYYACVLAALGQSVDAENMLAEAGAGPWERCARPAP